MKIIAATGCPTGIAHTFMAKEALEEEAKKQGLTIKVETHGQEGVQNELTATDIAEADGVIIAADKDVHAERFAGKRVINVPVTRGIKDPAALIAEIVNQTAPIMPGASITGEPQQSSEKRPKQSIGHSIYVALMNGVSHMLPIVVAGGVMIAISFMFGIYSADSKSEEFNQFAFYLNSIGGLAMSLMVPILTAYIAEAIAKRPGLIIGFIVGMIAYTNETGFLGGIVGGFLAGYVVLGLQYVLRKLPPALNGLKAIFLYPVLGIFIAGLTMWFLSAPMEAINQGMMSFLAGLQNTNPLILGIVVGMMCAFDMGGPVNKAAYVTGTALLAQGNFYFMAGVSAACIVPPLATGFAVLFGRKYYNQSDKSAGYVNFLLGSTHITEGAIPFAARNPLIILPILMLGSSIAAVLTYMMQVQVPAPHGGFIVLPIVTHGALWVMAIVIGSVVSGILMAINQKRIFTKEKITTENATVTTPQTVSTIQDVLQKENISLAVQGSNKDEVLQNIAAIAKEKGIISDTAATYHGFLKREQQGSTGMEQGIAIPHTENNAVIRPALMVVTLARPVDWDSLDGQPTTHVLAMFIPTGGSSNHLNVLSDVAKLLVHDDFITELKTATDTTTIYNLFQNKVN
ncbi:putative PTS system fructose-specific EIIABC component [Brochothrix thermosphacta]|uniref:fructose-specific PTS transporter subunit EIIC n=1 Tax=Brochothrix thermosphacta TaxID=2756 RepID=UPI00083FAAF3|nr:fructose-specific PTS transporter subunit EIIC [Brochothrix thermosphacta]ODJ64919.1 PTS fructose transporter subunit IIABC [Brochothrix thermosphacta]SPN73101.1 putative PTS system fructose-specific EIIABC component [Brochothrix thermosphacta]